MLTAAGYSVGAVVMFYLALASFVVMRIEDEAGMSFMIVSVLCPSLWCGAAVLGCKALSRMWFVAILVGIVSLYAVRLVADILVSKQLRRVYY